ncbi:MAG: RNase adapter RapZ [Elusimicrobiota bacterium]
MKKRVLYIITGISGAGKSQALKVFEDFGFFCVDNLPVVLSDSFSDLLMKSPQRRKVALGIDIRGGEYLKSFAESISKLRARGWNCRVLFVDASDKVVLQRFSETRHRHPLGNNLQQAIRRERRDLLNIKALADKIIDTSQLTLGELKEKISAAMEMKRTQEMILSVVSFGYKHGLPLDADLVMDVRFMPNPNYQPALKNKTGLDRPVQTYIRRQPHAKEFLRQFGRLVRSLLPHYIREGKSYLTIAIGCTGGRHRSVYIARAIYRELKDSGYRVKEYHRDLDR